LDGIDWIMDWDWRIVDGWGNFCVIFGEIGRVHFDFGMEK